MIYYINNLMSNNLMFNGDGKQLIPMTIEDKSLEYDKYWFYKEKIDWFLRQFKLKYHFVCDDNFDLFELLSNFEFNELDIIFQKYPEIIYHLNFETDKPLHLKIV